MSESQVLLKLGVKPEPNIAQPYKDIAKEARTAHGVVKGVADVLQEIVRNSRSLGDTREIWKGLTNEAGKYRDVLKQVNSESNKAFLRRGNEALANGVGPSRAPPAGPLFGGAAGLGIGLAAASYGLSYGASKLTDITSGDPQQVGRRAMNAASLGIGETLVSIQRAAEGINRLTAEIGIVERRRAIVLEGVRGQEALASIKAPFIEGQRAAIEEAAGLRTGIAGARIQAAGELSQFRIGGLQANLSEAQARFSASRGTAYLGAGQSISDINARIASEFGSQGAGNPATQRALLESRAALERAQSFEGGLRGQVTRQQGLVNDLTMRSDRARQQRDQVRRYGGPDPFGLGGLRGAEGNLTAAESLRTEAARKLVELQDRLLQSTERTKTAAEGYGRAQNESLAAEKERLTTAHGIAREQARAYRDLAFSLKQQQQVGLEGFSLSNPFQKNRALAVARKLAAGQNLNRLDIETAQGNSLISQSPLFQDFAKRRLAGDQQAQELRGLLGNDQRIDETERLAKEAGAREIKLADALKVNITVDTESMAAKIAQVLAPILKTIEQELKDAAARGVERGQRDQAANKTP